MSFDESPKWWKRAVMTGLAALSCCGVGCGGPSESEEQPVRGAAVSSASSRGSNDEQDVASSPAAKAVLSVLRARLFEQRAGDAAGDAPNEPVLPRGLADGFRAETGGLSPRFALLGPSPARVRLPARASEPVRIENATSDMIVEVSLRQSRESAAEVSEGYAVYRNAHASGATLLARARPDGFEDFLSFDSRPSVPSVEYHVALRHGVSGLRLVGGTLELLDGAGAPRLRVSPPYLVGADGARTDATISVDGCAVDTKPAAPWDRPVTAPGADTCTLRVSWVDHSVAYPALLDPLWSTTGSMGTVRQDHTATLLTTGRVLVAGGRTSGSTTTGLATAELFDRATGTWAATGSMTGARFSHSAVQLGTTGSSTTSGKVLIAGGINGSTSLNTAQLYSTAGTWVAAANLNAARHLHTATVLSNGQVLVAGGMSGTTVLNTAATYNPASGTGSWTATGTMAVARRSHTATRLVVPGNTTLNNRVLVVGGNSGGSTSLASVQLFDNTNWSAPSGIQLSSSREGQAAVALANGNVLVTGGKSGSTTLNTALLFNAASGSGSWANAGTMTSARQLHAAALVPAPSGGQVLVAGGSTNGTNSLNTAELWNGTNAWTSTVTLGVPMRAHTATVLAGGPLLVAGGLNGSTTLASSQLFALTCSSNSQCASGFCADGVCCDQACTGNTCRACNLPGLAGTCSPKPNATSCSDGNACTQTDTCQAGTCSGSNPVACTALDECHVAGTCNTSTGVCSNPNKTGSCNDGNPCTQNDTCQSGSCVGGGAPGVDDNNPCTVDSCNTASGVVHSWVPEFTPCPDNSVCDGLEVCRAGVCTEEAPGATSTCAAGTHVTFYQSYNGGTTVDIAASGVRTPTTNATLLKTPGLFGEAIDGSSEPWIEYHTDWYANPTNVVLSKPGSASVWMQLRSDYRGAMIFNALDTNHYLLVADDTYGVWARLSGGPPGSDDVLAYMDRPASWKTDGAWHLVVVNWAPGGIELVVDGVSTGTRWAPWMATPFHGPATTNWIVAGGSGSGYSKDELVILDRALTRDEILWYYAQRLNPPPVNPALERFGTDPVGCNAADDLNPCTADSCDPVLGAVHTPVINGTSCSDGFACTQNDSCQNGVCESGPAIGVNDNNPCTDDWCNIWLGGELHTPHADGTACGDGNACNGTEACANGVCQTGTPTTCVATDRCHTAGTCDPATGACTNPPVVDGTSCGDGNACNGAEACVSGTCTPEVPGASLTCTAETRVSFYQSWDTGATAEIGVEPRTPRGDDTLVRVPGLFGQALDSATNNDLNYHSGGYSPNPSNMVLSKPGSLSMWVRPRSGGPLGIFFVAYSSLFKVVLGDYSGGPAAVFERPDLAMAASSALPGAASWNLDQRWHLVVLNWSPSGFNFSVDGVWSPVINEPWLKVDVPNWGSAIYPRGISTGAFDTDEFMVLDRPLTHEEVAWYYAQRDNPTLPNPALARFTSASGGCNAADDMNPCTADSCDAVLGARHEPVADGTACGDGNACNGNETCQAGACQAGPPVTCVATDQCHGAGTCDPNTGTCSNPVVADGTPCDDGQACSQADTCQTGSCRASNSCGTPESAITLRANGVVDLENGEFVAVFGYDSSATTDTEIPLGPETNSVALNGIPVTTPDPRPPVQFHPGVMPGAFLPKFNAGTTISWSAAGDTVTATDTSPHLTKVPLGANGFGVQIGDRFVEIQPDSGQYANTPAEPTYQDEPAVGAIFNGALSGELSVGPTGAAIYTVPISIPPGVNGMAPNLNLVYNSQGGNGIAGQGWELAGLSMIHRCPKTRVHDGVATPVAMGGLDGPDAGTTDGVCLDGKRLFLRTSNPNTGSTFEPAVKDFTRITLDQLGRTFTVVTKSGETRYYGLRADSRVRLPLREGTTIVPPSDGNVTAIWALDRVMDAWGNYYDIYYNDGLADFSARGLLVTAIKYTGHALGSAHHGEAHPNEPEVLPFETVTFRYDPTPRSDVRHTRFRDSTLPRNRRLQTITSSKGQYELSYAANDPFLPSRLESIKFCRGPANCLEPLVFDWDQGAYAWEERSAYRFPASVSTVNGLPGTQLVDLDNDGRLDFVRAKAGTPTIVSRNTGASFAPAPGTWALPPSASLVKSDGSVAGAKFADFNGDGAMDLIVAPGRTPEDCEGWPVPFCEGNIAQHHEIWLNRIKSESGWVRLASLETVPASWFPLDFTTTDTTVDMNGDGLADIVRFGTGDNDKLRVLINLGDSWYDQPSLYAASWLSPIREFRLVDVNRDGLPDLVKKTGNNTGTVVAGINSGDLSASQLFVQHTFTGDLVTNAAPGTDVLGDVDGDGLYDAVWHGPPQFGMYVGVSFSTALGYSTGISSASGFFGSYTPEIWENRGTDPLAFPYQQSLARQIAPHGPATSAANEIVTLADLNADGLVDFVQNHAGSGQVLLNTGVSFEDAYGVETWQASAGQNAIPIVPVADPGATFVDLDGDGVTDVANATTAWINKFRPPVIRQFPDGLARKTSVSYVPITSAEAQTAPVGSQPTYVNSRVVDPGTLYYALPLRVVSSKSEDDGLGSTSTTSYRYLDLRASRTGHGVQGFRAVTTTEASGVETRTTYAQAFPFTGLTTRVDRSSVDRVTKVPTGPLTTTRTEYCDTLPEETGLDCTPSTGPAVPPVLGVPPASGTESYGPRKTVVVYARKVEDTTYLRTSVATEPSPQERIVTTSEFQYDRYGNALHTTVSIKGMNGDVVTETHTTETLNAYGAAGSEEERLGKVTLSTVTSEKVGSPDSTTVHTSAFKYANVNTFWPAPNGLQTNTLALVEKEVEPGAGVGIELDTAYDYDRFGNIVATTSCADDFDHCLPGAPGPSAQPFRTERASFDPADFNGALGATLAYGKGRFPVKVTNALGHAEYTAYDFVHGVVTQRTGPNGVHTCYTHDVFGRQVAETSRCGTAAPVTTNVHQYLTTSAQFPLARAVTVTRPPAGGATWEYSDALGRPIGNLSRSFDGGFTRTLTTYDALGRTLVTTEPHPASTPASAAVTLRVYDDLGRVKSLIKYLGNLGGSTTAASIVETEYRGSVIRTKQTVDGQERHREERKNAVGKVTSVTDSNDVTISYKHDSDGNLIETRDPEGNVTRIEYDQRGRKRLTVDPDMGEWSYVYNGFGELESQTDAKHQQTSMTYDELGRMRSKTDASGTAYWLYDVGPGAALGKLAAVISAPDTELSSPCTIPYLAPTGAMRVGRWFEYSPFGEILEAFECVDGTTFQTSYSYDAVGRQRVIRYPEVNGDRLAVENHYSNAGFLHYLTNATDHSLYWAATSVNARGQVTAEYTRSGVETVSTRNPATGWLMARSSTAHGDLDTLIQDWHYEYDEAGNLRRRRRTDAVNGRGSDESFGYDRLDRLTSSGIDVGGNYQAAESYAYDALGNLTQKGGKTYRYGTCSHGPHAVCEVVGDSFFDYDTNGNMLSGYDRSIEYNAENKVTKIESHPSPVLGNEGAVIRFIYGADDHRVVQAVEDADGNPVARTVYVGMGATGKSLYERTTRAGEIEHAQFIYAGDSHGGSPLALRLTQQFGESTAPSTIKYYHYDHLGSVTAMSDERGRVLDAASGGADASVMGYDAWGARRNPDGTSASSASFHQQPGAREFTGHETIPNVGLVNMNGRVYDPLLGRFLSPDPSVQFVANLQSYNRYSYVLNNPLRYTDPTGYFVNGWVDFGVNLGLSLGAILICTGPQAVACGMGFALAAAIYNTSSAIYAGVPWGQAVGMSVMGLIVGGVAGGSVGVLGGGPYAQLIAGGLSGALSGAINARMSGEDLGPSMLKGAAVGVTMAAVSMNAQMVAPVSVQSADESEGFKPSSKIPEKLDLGDYLLTDPTEALAPAFPSLAAESDPGLVLAAAEGGQKSKSDAGGLYDRAEWVPSRLERWRADVCYDTSRVTIRGRLVIVSGGLLVNGRVIPPTQDPNLLITNKSCPNGWCTRLEAKLRGIGSQWIPNGKGMDSWNDAFEGAVKMITQSKNPRLDPGQLGVPIHFWEPRSRPRVMPRR